MTVNETAMPTNGARNSQARSRQVIGSARTARALAKKLPGGMIIDIKADPFERSPKTGGHFLWMKEKSWILPLLMEPIAAIAGSMMVSVSAVILPWGLAGAAGAMLFVVSHEIIPESHRRGHETLATGGLIIGFVLMMLMDTLIG